MVLQENIAPVSLNQDELVALKDISLSLTPIPKLKKRYLFASFLICAQAVIFGLVAVISPEWFVEHLISPSIEETDFLVSNTRIRGSFTIFIVFLWLFKMYDEKWSTMITNVAIVWVVVMSILDFLKVFYLDIFEATPESALFTIWRPTLVFLIYYMRSKMNEYFRARKLHELSQ
jgi:hypothetical protein